MNTFLKILKAFFWMLVLLVVVYAGAFFLSYSCGRIGEVIGILIIVFAFALPFMYTNKKHPFSKNIKVAILGCSLLYLGLVVFYALGLCCNMLLNLDAHGVIIILLGFALIVLFNVILVGTYILMHKIRKTNKKQ